MSMLGLKANQIDVANIAAGGCRDKVEDTVLNTGIKFV